MKSHRQTAPLVPQKSVVLDKAEVEASYLEGHSNFFGLLVYFHASGVQLQTSSQLQNLSSDGEEVRGGDKLPGETCIGFM